MVKAQRSARRIGHTLPRALKTGQRQAIKEAPSLGVLGAKYRDPTKQPILSTSRELRKGRASQPAPRYWCQAAAWRHDHVDQAVAAARLLAGHEYRIGATRDRDMAQL